MSTCFHNATIKTHFSVQLAFVTKLSTSSGTQAETSVAAHQRQDFSIRTSENSNNKRVTSSNNLAQLAGDADDESEAHDADSEGSSDSELFEFDVYERDGYDKIIQTVSGGQHQDDFARQVCRHLELFESLCPSRSVLACISLWTTLSIFNLLIFLHLFLTAQRENWIPHMLSTNHE